MNDIQWMRLRRGQHHPADDTVIWWAACESGHELWSGPDRETYDKAKYDAKQHDDDSHSGMETAVVLDTGLVRPASIMTSVINTPATYQPSPSAREAVKSLYDRTIMATFPNYSFVDVKDLVFQWGEAAIVENTIATLPTKLERHELTYTNCLDTEDTFPRRIKDKTIRSISYSIEQSITSSNEFRLGVSIPVGSYLKFNADLITKNSITTNNKESQSYSEEIEIDYDETFKIPAKSILKYRYTAIKGLIKAQIRGKVIIDALFTYRLRDGDGHDHYFDIWTSNTHLLPNSQDRMVDYSGEITNEGYEHLDIIKKADKIEDPKVCEWLAVFR